jgi:predicted ATP-dependent endonuclease of OLD family
MKKIKLKNFKAFESEIELKNPQAKNILLFGENGSGKSSIYEALRYVFYQEEIEKVDTLLPLPDQRAKIDSIRSNLTNQHSALPFSIELVALVKFPRIRTLVIWYYILNIIIENVVDAFLFC